MSTLSQKETIFCVLYKAFRNPEKAPEGTLVYRYIPVFDFTGEHFISELDRWGYASHECTSRLSEIFNENPGLLQRQTITGKSGARYNGYRFSPKATPALIRDERLLRLYYKLRPDIKRTVAQSVSEADRTWEDLD